MLRTQEQNESGLTAIPVLEDYDVSPVTGFVPFPRPLGRLTQAYYQPWEEIMDKLNELIDTRQLRARVDNMPLLNIDQLTTLREQQRAIVILSFMAQSYVWGHGLDIAQSIPEPLAIPYQAISEVLDIPPTLTYASNDLWNWKLINENGPYTLDNLSTLHVMTGTHDETWFDIVPVAVEIEGGAALQPLLESIQAVRDDDLPTVVQKLNLALPQLQKVGKTLARMFEKCDPAVFYWKIRKFLAGSEDSANLGLPNGLVFQGVDNDRPKHYMGATAGQSSIFAALDLFFGIQHLEKSSSSSSPSTTSQNGEKAAPNAMLQKMKLYMPGPHRAFLDHLAKVANLRDYVLAKSTAEGFETNAAAQDLVQIYDACLHQIKLFRDTHIQVVTRYIMTQARRGPPEGWEDYRVKVDVAEPLKPTNGTVTTAAAAAAAPVNGNHEVDPPMKGSGGSDLMPFLKTNRDETQSAKVVQPPPKK
ncbi:hypothetical protein BGZ83_002974 [Gryganskiella cystojenkinii]|nr:hypothetical protein BGZ83_002974 [Gryganskiella cystojenkinii]